MKNKLVLIFIAFTLASESFADQSKELLAQINNGQLNIKTSIEPSDGAVVSQQLILNIEVATKRWFVAGTRIGRFDLDGAVVLRREKFATNSTKRVAGQTWVVQNWTLTIYPQRSGEFVVPEIGLQLSIAGDGGGSITGVVNTSPVSFSVGVPPELKDTKNWVATNTLALKQSFSSDIDGLKVGDALVRTIEVKAENIAAMMLPSVLKEEYDGIAVYNKLPEVIDEVNRGSYLASRVEELTYVFEKEGSYLIPPLEFYWWDTTAQSVRIEALPEQTLIVALGGAVTSVAQQPLAQRPLSERLGDYKDSILQLLLLIFVSGFSVFILFKLSKLLLREKKPTARNLAVEFDQACHNGDIQLIIKLTYHWLEQNQSIDEVLSIRQLVQYQKNTNFKQLFDRVMGRAYGRSAIEKIDIAEFGKEVSTLHAQLNSSLQCNDKRVLQLN